VTKKAFINLFGYCALDNILTIDLEDWHHPEYVKRKISHVEQERINESTKNTLRLLKECKVNATFFVVGEIAEKHPELIEKISENGHEIAFHGYHHEQLWRLDAEMFHSQIQRFKSLIQEKCRGFRAPSFSLNNETKWSLTVLEDTGFLYDSSIFPSRTPLYGVSKAPIRPYKLSYEDITKEDPDAKLWEFPLLVYPLIGLKIPMAGGFFLRFFPTYLVKRTIKKMGKLGFPAVLYVHSWELDAQTPKLKLGPYASFATYHNVQETEGKLKQIVKSFRFSSFRDYINKHNLSDF